MEPSRTGQPTDQRTGYDVVVLGGGVIGWSCAWRAAQRGLSVAVCDPSPGTGASHVAAGMLAPVTELHPGEEDLLRLNLAAARGYEAFAAEVEAASGLGVGYRRCGTLALALDAGDRAVLAEAQDLQRSLGLDSHRLTARECRRLEPMLSTEVTGGLLVEGDHQVDNRRLLAALRAAAGRAGVDLLPERAAVRTADGRAVGVELAGGRRVDAGQVLLTAGAAAADVAGVPEAARPPVRPVKGQILRLRVPAPLRPVLSRTVRGVVRGAAVYLVPREDGELVVGATSEDRGFDETVTAGGVYELLRDAQALLPAVTELELVETAARCRPGSPDNAPLVGATVVPGLLLATGHHRNGMLLAGVTGEAVAALLGGDGLPEHFAPFTPGRFRTPEPAGAPR
ncbi:glycine oxidase [Kineococcus xinjiangensis]|uniref:glycine oxidase n=1 Tax=Kineococcus xinjiangensis TaxID=512762 RepID=A0A2S6IP32_9ACTN|nr:glycine oxidase ThiO [Kineococcus xinjiangensis]PPK95979.1 glycine oxidase [Kineococcus xinjiangensis]